MVDTRDALPLAVFQTGGNTSLNLLDLLTNAYGDQVSSIASINIEYRDWTYLQNSPAPNPSFSYWSPGVRTITHVVDDSSGVPVELGGQGATVSMDSKGINHGVDGQWNPTTVTHDNLHNITINVGNNIMPNVYFTIDWAVDGTHHTSQEFTITTVPDQMTSMAAFDGIVDPNDIVAAARAFATAYGGVPNANDCHWMATTIAAAAGATFDPVTQEAMWGGKDAAGNDFWLQNPASNQEGGFWRIVDRGSDNPVDNWQTLVRPGDIVRMGWSDALAPDGKTIIHGQQHTLTVTEGLNAAGQIRVVDNTDTGGTIGEHWVDFDGAVTMDNSITIYRLSPDHMYLTNGNDGDETLVGTSFNDEIHGGGGKDIIIGGKGNDHLFGDGGADILRGGEGQDRLEGGAGDDTYYVGEGDTVFEARQIVVKGKDIGGLDTVMSEAGSFTLPDRVENLTYIGTGNFINGTGNGLANVIEGRGGTDTLYGLGGQDTLRGNDGTDTLYGGADNDQLYGGNDKVLDWLDGGTGADTMRGGPGSDVYVVDNAGDKVIELQNEGEHDRVLTTLQEYRLDVNVEEVLFQGADTLGFHGVGNSLANIISGRGGRDILEGAGGNDTIDGGNGIDTAVFSGHVSDYRVELLQGNWVRLTDLRAGSPDGTDTIANVEMFKFADKTIGLSDLHNTVAPASVSISDASVVEGNGGTAHAVFTVSRSGGTGAFDVSYTTADISAKTSDSDYLSKSGTLHFLDGQMSQQISIDVTGDTRVEGSETFAVNLAGATSGATISDSQGIGSITNDDVAPAGQTLIGTGGNDTLTGGAGADRLEGGDGNDTLVGGAGADQLLGGAGTDFLWIDAQDTLVDGGDGFDYVYLDYTQAQGQHFTVAGTNTECVSAYMGNDVIDATGVTYSVFLFGNYGNDTLIGGSGNDSLQGSVGDDTLTGGAGRDTFIFADLEGHDTVTDFTHGQDILDMTAVSGLNNLSQLTITDTAQGALIAFGNDSILLQGVATNTLSASDFHLHI